MERAKSGNKDLDLILGGGVPLQTITLVGGAIGTGKRTLVHQILYANLTPETKAIYATVLGKPAHKILRSIQDYEFFNSNLLLSSLHYEDAGEHFEKERPKKFLDYVFSSVSHQAPDFFCMDGIHRFRGMCALESDYHAFLYELSGILSAAGVSTFWTGLFPESDLPGSPEAGLSDSVLSLSRAEGHRTLQVLKLARTPCPAEPHRYSISERGVRIEGAGK